MASNAGLQGKNILITGATDGIGLLLARAYAKRGHNVLATGRRGIANDQEFFKFSNITYHIRP